MSHEKELLKILNQDRSKGVELIFNEYYDELCEIATKNTKDWSLAEDVVQKVFYEFFKSYKILKFDSLIGYLKNEVDIQSMSKD